MAMRGLRTLSVRLARHHKSGLEVARWLEQWPEVLRVLHPALPGAPGHDIWKRDFTGACGLFAVVFKPVPEKALLAFLNALTLYGMGASWGGFESLAIPVRRRALSQRDEVGAGRAMRAAAHRTRGRRRPDRRSRTRTSPRWSPRNSRSDGQLRHRDDGRARAVARHQIQAGVLRRGHERDVRSHRAAQSARQRHRIAAGPWRAAQAIAGAGRAPRARRILRLDARLSPRREGPDRDKRHPHHARLADLQGFRPDGRRHRGRPHEARAAAS